MNILTINAGSSSLKYKLIDSDKNETLVTGLCERIGSDEAVFHFASHKEVRLICPIKNHKVAVEMVMNALVDQVHGVIDSYEDIHAVGHRIAHGGEACGESFIITDETVDIVKENIKLAPLHNGANLMGIEACGHLMKDILMVGVPDTAFHHTIPEYAYIYPIPYELYKKHKIRKYGFHGTSHKYVTDRAAELLKRPKETLKIVSCHLGNGSSITAVKNGRSMENSMGFTPLDGIPMGTRSGAIDPAIPHFLEEEVGMTSNEVNELLNKQSGLLGLSGISNDFRDIHVQSAQGNPRAILAEDVFSYRVKKCIGEYAAAMGGIDCLVFTAGIGENDAIIRRKITDGLAFLGIDLDESTNSKGRIEGDISSPEARVKTLVVFTDEELVIAKEAERLFKER